ncbi:MAG TPA: hypothetical protein VG099_23095, partial [Gemmataceae bacterium]|nr:hypothetical protein [Gemmataceae bacterium]
LNKEKQGWTRVREGLTGLLVVATIMLPIGVISAVILGLGVRLEIQLLGRLQWFRLVLNETTIMLFSGALTLGNMFAWYYFISRVFFKTKRLGDNPAGEQNEAK